MVNRCTVLCAMFALLLVAPKQASADWLLTGFIGPLTNVKTSEAPGIARAETFAGSTGFGVNLASAFPGAGNAGFELDWGYYPKALEESDVFETAFAQKLMVVSTNFFFSPSIPRVRPYFSAGPMFTNKSDTTLARLDTASAWAIGFNAGGGVIVFANERVGARIDLRYHRNITDFIDLADVGAGTQGWNKLTFFRVFFGGTVVL
jgi:opacity protein-like surface antigen